MLKHWPKTNAFKEQRFLKRIGVILDFLDEDIWRKVDVANNPKQYNLFKTVSYKILHVLQNALHHKTIHDILDLIEQDEVQQVIEKYGGKHLWCSLYQSLNDIVSYFVLFETIDKTKETMNTLKNEDYLPMQHKNTFNEIESGKVRMYPLSITVYKQNHFDSNSEKAIKRKRKYDKIKQCALFNKQSMAICHTPNIRPSQCRKHKNINTATPKTKHGTNYKPKTKKTHIESDESSDSDDTSNDEQDHCFINNQDT